MDESNEMVAETTEQEKCNANEKVDSEGNTVTECKDESVKDSPDPVNHTKDETKKDKQSVRLDLKLHHQAHTKSTLPHILTEYGLEDKTRPHRKHGKSKQKKKNDLVMYDEEDDIRRQRKDREEKFRQNFGDSNPVNAYYAEYSDCLEQKVLKQRLKYQLQREDEHRLAQLAEDDHQKHRLQRRLEHVTLKHNSKFTKNLHKTDVSRIIILQDQMRKEGRLKTQIDVDKFWDEIQRPDIFYDQFKVKKATDPNAGAENNKNSSSLSDQEILDRIKALPPTGGPDILAPAGTDMQIRSLSHISERHESSRTSDRASPWAITQKFQSVYSAKTPEKPKKDSTQAAREAAIDLDRRCPRLDMPPLACFSLRLGGKTPDPEEIRRELEVKLRQKHRKKHQRKVRRMHQMAMTNAAAANRILAQHGHLAISLEGAPLRDVLAVFDEPQLTDISEYPHPYPPGSPLSPVSDVARPIDVYPEDVMDASRREFESRDRPSSETTASSSVPSSKRLSKMKRKKKSPEMIEYPMLPLTYNEIMGTEKVLDAKCVSTNWVNYMNAGKSAFAS